MRRLFRQADCGEEVKDPFIVDEVDPFGVETDKMSAIFTAVSPHAGIDAEKIGIGAIDALPQRHANFWHRDVAGTADREKILAEDVVFTVLQMIVVFEEAENPAAHEDVRSSTVIRLDLFEAFIHPVDAVLTVNHLVLCSD